MPAPGYAYTLPGPQQTRVRPSFLATILLYVFFFTMARFIMAWYWTSDAQVAASSAAAHHAQPAQLGGARITEKGCGEWNITALTPVHC